MASASQRGPGDAPPARGLPKWYESLFLVLLNTLDVSTRVLGPMLIVFAAALIALNTWTYFDAIMPALGFDVFSVPWLAITSVGLYILYSIVYNYANAVLTPPGCPTDVSSAFASELGGSVVDEEAPAAPLRNRGTEGVAVNPVQRAAQVSDVPNPNSTTRCRKCEAPKPPRTHHCHVCNRCVLKMDHHCPWLNNCVGHRNYHYFFKVLLYVWAGCTFIAATSALPFIRGAHLTAEGMGRPPLGREARLGLCFVLGIAIGVAVGAMAAWHVYLTATAQTSIEFYQNASNRARMRHRGMVYRNPFDLGVTRNWEETFGTASWRWILPVAQGAKGDGLTFPAIG